MVGINGAGNNYSSDELKALSKQRLSANLLATAKDAVSVKLSDVIPELSRDRLSGQANKALEDLKAKGNGVFASPEDLIKTLKQNYKLGDADCFKIKAAAKLSTQVDQKELQNIQKAALASGPISLEKTVFINNLDNLKTVDKLQQTDLEGLKSSYDGSVLSKEGKAITLFDFVDETEVNDQSLDVNPGKNQGAQKLEVNTKNALAFQKDFNSYYDVSVAPDLKGRDDYMKFVDLLSNTEKQVIAGSDRVIHKAEFTNFMTKHMDEIKDAQGINAEKFKKLLTTMAEGNTKGSKQLQSHLMDDLKNLQSEIKESTLGKFDHREVLEQGDKLAKIADQLNHLPRSPENAQVKAQLMNTMADYIKKYTVPISISVDRGLNNERILPMQRCLAELLHSDPQGTLDALRKAGPEQLPGVMKAMVDDTSCRPSDAEDTHKFVRAELQNALVQLAAPIKYLKGNNLTPTQRDTVFQHLQSFAETLHAVDKAYGSVINDKSKEAEQDKFYQELLLKAAVCGVMGPIGGSVAEKLVGEAPSEAALDEIWTKFKGKAGEKAVEIFNESVIQNNFKDMFGIAAEHDIERMRQEHKSIQGVFQKLVQNDPEAMAAMGGMLSSLEQIDKN